MASAQLTLQSVEFAHPGMTAPLFTELTAHRRFHPREKAGCGGGPK